MAAPKPINSPKPLPTYSSIDRAWLTPFTYSKLRLRHDWQLDRGEGHVVGEEPADSWLILVLRAIHWVGNAISPWEWLNFALVGRLRSHSWLRSKHHIKARYWVGDLYAFVTTLATIAIARHAAHVAPHSAVRAAILAFCIWRLFEIYRTVLRFIVIDYIGAGYPHTTISAIRYLMYIPQYAIQTVLIFAIIYLYWTPTGFSGGGLPELFGISSYAYISLTTITTLGSGYTAVTEAAREWQVFESATGLVLFSLGISTFLSGLKLRRRSNRED